MSIIFYRSPVDFYQRLQSTTLPRPTPFYWNWKFFIKFWFQKIFQPCGGGEAGWGSVRKLSQRGCDAYASSIRRRVEIEFVLVVDLFCWGSLRSTNGGWRGMRRLHEFLTETHSRGTENFGFSDSWGSNFYHNILFRGFHPAFAVCSDATRGKHNRTRRQKWKITKIHPHKKVNVYVPRCALPLFIFSWELTWLSNVHMFAVFIGASGSVETANFPV